MFCLVFIIVLCLCVLLGIRAAPAALRLNFVLLGRDGRGRPPRLLPENSHLPHEAAGSGERLDILQGVISMCRFGGIRTQSTAQEMHQSPFKAWCHVLDQD